MKTILQPGFQRVCATICTTVLSFFLQDTIAQAATSFKTNLAKTTKNQILPENKRIQSDTTRKNNIAQNNTPDSKSNALKKNREIELQGTVLSDTDEPLPGVTITVKVSNSKTSGTFFTQTDASGRFSFKQLNPNETYDFEFSFIGYAPTELTAFQIKDTPEGNRLDIVLLKKSEQMEEVVVTALGIKREEKSLGYSAQKLDDKSVTDAKTSNWANALNGKVAGLNVQNAGTGPMGSSRITLRGENSLNLENNQALIIIDGIPVSNKMTGTGFNSHLSADSPVDYGSAVNDINPDDIENITILKGPGATALYGSRAAGGALIITTKSGSRKGKGIGITVNSNASMDQVNRWPEYQYEYGEGRTDKYFSYLNSDDGPNTGTTVAAARAWGPKFNGQMYYQYNPAAPDGKPTERTPWVAYDNYIKGFFQTGKTFSNSISLEGGSEKGSARLSLTHFKNEWIIPNTGFERINAALSLNQKINDKLQISGKVNYSNKKSDNLPMAGYNNQTLMYFLIAGTTPNVNPAWFKPYWMPGLENIQQSKPFNSGPDNPYAGMYEMLNKMNKNSVIGNITANYKINSNLEMMVRSGVDFYAENRSQQRPFSMTKYPQGMYREQQVFGYEINSDILLTYKNKLSASLDFSVSTGANAMHQSYDFVGMNADRLAQPGIYQISNSLDPAVVDPLRTEKAINSIYGMTQISWNDKIFLDITGRNDWSSTLPYESKSFFYPSLSSSFLLHDLMLLPTAVSFAKLRVSWAQVGNDTRPYQTKKYYDKIYGNSFTNPAVLYNKDLKPEIATSLEAGLDIRLLRNRLGADMAIYNSNSRNQILEIPLDIAGGYDKALVNAGLINSKGVEVQVYGKPVAGKNFSWKATLNWSMNRSYVKELTDDITSQQIYAHASNVTIEARVGGRMGDLYGKGFQRSPEGAVIYSSVGLPAALDPVTKKWGNAFADWKAGILNEFTFRGFNLSILLDGQKGGAMFSQTSHKNNTLGKTKVTLPGREEGIIGDGVVLQSDGKYLPNTVKVPASSYYDAIYAISNAEMNIYDASFLKIREVRLAFTLPEQWLRKLGVMETNAAVYGRDLFNFTKFPGFDPEGGNLNNGTVTPGVELAQFPSARTMGINLTFKF